MANCTCYYSVSYTQAREHTGDVESAHLSDNIFMSHLPSNSTSSSVRMARGCARAGWCCMHSQLTPAWHSSTLCHIQLALINVNENWRRRRRFRRSKSPMKGIGKSRGASTHSATVARLSRNSGDETRVYAAVRFKLPLDTFDAATAGEEEFVR